MSQEAADAESAAGTESAVGAKGAVGTEGVVGAVILAAGTGKRLGGVAKALLGRDTGPSFLERVHATALAAGVTDLVVVIGPPHAEETGAEAARLGLPVVVNPAPERGMASSVAVGFAHALAAFGHARAALLWPVDHPAVRPQTVQALIARMLAKEAPGAVEAAEKPAVVIPTLHGRGGHPTGFARDLWQDLAACWSAPEGARSVIQQVRARAPERIMRIAVDDAGVIADVDIPQDLAATSPAGSAPGSPWRAR